MQPNLPVISLKTTSNSEFSPFVVYCPKLSFSKSIFLTKIKLSNTLMVTLNLTSLGSLNCHRPFIESPDRSSPFFFFFFPFSKEHVYVGL